MRSLHVVYSSQLTYLVHIPLITYLFFILPILINFIYRQLCKFTMLPTSRVLRRTLQTFNTHASTRNSSQVLCDITGNGHVAVLTLNAPSKLNALSEEMGDELTDHVAKLKENYSLRCCVVTGGGKGIFNCNY